MSFTLSELGDDDRNLLVRRALEMVSIRLVVDYAVRLTRFYYMRSPARWSDLYSAIMLVTSG